jgi:FMN-dependent NADH-azoreductase
LRLRSGHRHIHPFDRFTLIIVLFYLLNKSFNTPTVEHIYWHWENDMTTLLKLNTSLFSQTGASNVLTDEFAARLVEHDPTVHVIDRDLAREPIPHLTAERFQSFLAPADSRTPEQHAHVAYSDALIDELRAADVIVLGLPMYNFGIPSMLKAYFDHVARAGVTFRYTEKGPEGLLKGKKAYILATRGGKYAGTPIDTATRYVSDFLAFIGITDVEFVYAEGLAYGDAAKQQSLTEARASIKRIARPEPLARVA